MSSNRFLFLISEKLDEVSSIFLVSSKYRGLEKG
jgi:hypothetical protein